MSVDLEAIAQRGRCDVSSLRLAIPLLEQGYSPPFLARYRRDELGGLDESSLWALATALQTEQQVQQRREELTQIWEKTRLRDPAISHALRKSNSLRMLNRLGRRLKHETGDAVDQATALAVRVLNPQQGDGEDLQAIAASVEGLESADEAIAGLDAALAKRLAGDPRIVSAAVRWLSKNAKVHIATIHDPHLPGDDDSSSGEPESKQAKSKAAAAKQAESKEDAAEQAAEAAQETQPDEATAAAEPAQSRHAGGRFTGQRGGRPRNVDPRAGAASCPPSRIPAIRRTVRGRAASSQRWRCRRQHRAGDGSPNQREPELHRQQRRPESLHR